MIYDFNYWRRGQEPKDALLVGKGPTFSSALSAPPALRLISLNHTVAKLPRVDIAFMVDVEVGECPEVQSAFSSAPWVMMPWRPNFKFCQTAATIEDLAKERPWLQSLIERSKIVAFEHCCGVPGLEKCGIETYNFSSEPAACVAAILGAKTIYLAGIDGGADYHPAFDRRHCLANGRQSFDPQFAQIDKIAKHYGVAVKKLAEVEWTLAS